MHFDLTPYIILPILSAIMNAILAGISFRERRTPAAMLLFWTTLCISAWSLTFVVETVASALTVKAISRNIIGSLSCITAVTLVALSIETTGLKSAVTKRLLIYASIVPFISVALFCTSPLHRLQLYDYHIIKAGEMFLLGFSEGPFFKSGHISYNFLLHSISILILAAGYWRSPKSEWPRYSYMIVAGLTSLIVAVFEITPVKGFNFTSSTFLLSGILYFTAIFRYRLLDLVPIARETLIEIMADPVVVVDSNGNIALANQKARETFNIADNTCNCSLQETFRKHPEVASRIADLSAFSDECTLNNDDSCASWQINKTPIEFKGVHQGWIITFKDISTLKNANLALRKTNELLTIYSMVVEQSPISIVITDLSGRIEFVNPAFSEITGYTLEEVLGENPSILKSGLTSPEVFNDLWNTITAGKIWEGEFINRKKTGEFFTEQAIITPIKDRDGTIRHYVGVKEDISERKKIEAELQNLNKSLLGRIDEEATRRMEQERLLANQARLVAMGEMIGAIAHQWRQPLATLAMIVQRMHAVGSMQGITPEQLLQFKDNAMRQIKYMSDTIEEFRSFYSKEKNPELFSPIKCINDAIRLFEPQFTSAGIHVEIRGETDPDKKSKGFPNEFKQVILNLLGNARDAIVHSRESLGRPEKGRITIEIAVPSANIMNISISDNGSGIPEDIVNRIFDPYFTTKEKDGGTGIGLYMSRMIMQESLGGSLRLLKSKDGAIFRIKLPLGGHK